jgi:hypothetical protein
MDIQFTDFNGADQLLAQTFSAEWESLLSVLEEMPLHLKASDQAGIQGNAIFDPVGTNQYIAANLVTRQWQAKIAIPPEFRFLGTDVDFGKRGTVVEVQFSNYPFLLNNLLRSELFFRSRTIFDQAPSQLALIVTKAGMFPASQSTLYYEQARSQLSALSSHGVFSVPIRLIGLFSHLGEGEAIWTRYGGRYSRDAESRERRKFVLTASGRPSPSNRCRIRAVINPEDL